jgi:Holliday junction DNA helicase RuvA
MISHLKGTVLHLDLKYIVLDVGGVGYKVFVTTSSLERLSHAEGLVSLWIYTAVREDALDLYGFATREDMEFFELLLTISGIGPKSAQGILNIASADTIKEAIYTDDPSYLTKVSGIGKKSAEKIVRELKDKIGVAPTQNADGSPMKNNSESTMAIEALISLGFSADESREAVKKIDKTLSTTEQVKQALKLLQ